MPVDTPPTPRFTAALEDELRGRAGRRRRRLPSARPVIAMAAVAVALAFVLLPRAGDDAGDQTSPPPKTEPAETFVLERPSRNHPPLAIDIQSLLKSDRARIDRLRPEFRKRGAVLAVRERPVRRRSADGQVFSVGSRIRPDQRRRDGKIVVDETVGIMTVSVGRLASEIPPKSGVTVLEAFPEVCELIVDEDPAGTVRRLRGAGFTVTVVPTPWNNPGVAPKVFAVRDGEARFNDADPSKRSLVIVVGPPGEGHTGGVRC